MSTGSVPRTIPGMIRDLYERQADLERRVQNKKRTGTVHEVNAAEGWARVKLGEDENGKPYLSPKMPWKEVAMGAIKTHFPPAVGEQVDVVSESGDLADAMIDTSIPSNANARPHDKAAEGVITVGNTRIQFTGSEVRITSPKIVLEGECHIGGEGGQLVHRKGDVDSDGDAAVGSATKVYAL